MQIVKEMNHKTESLLMTSDKSFVFKSILEGNTPGYIYVDEIKNPNYYTVLDLGNFVLYIGGDSNKQEECFDFITQCILTDSLKISMMTGY